MNSEANLERQEFNTGSVATISSAHAIHDTYTGFLAPLLPVLIQKFSLTNTAAGLLSVFIQIPSLIQPFIGYLADHQNLKWMIILTPAISGTAMSLLGIAPNYGILTILLLLTGFSSAALHAVGPGVGSNHSGNKLGRGMSFWMVAGELGRALGPIVVVSAIRALTLEGLPWLMLGGIVASFFLYHKLKTITTLSSQSNNNQSRHWKNALAALKITIIPVAILIFTRSLVTSALSTYLPTFLTTQGSSLWMAGASLTILEIAGMVGAFLAGTLSDRFGRRRMLLISFIATPILLISFIYANGIWRIPLLILLGFFVLSVSPVIMAVVMENASDNRSFANGIYMSVSFVLHAITILLVGLLSDWLNMQITFLISALVVPAGIPAIFMLRKLNQDTEID